jgi:hypothetical protein
MARIALTCGCGWTFFIQSSTPGLETACPSCSRPVPIPGRKPGMEIPLTPGEIAAKLQHRAGLVRFVVLLGLAGAAAGAFYFWRGLPHFEEEPAAPTAKSRFDPASRPSRPSIVLDTPPPVLAPPARPIAELRHRAHENLWMVNMASVLSECLRYRNLAREWSLMQADVAVYEGRLQADLKELAAAGEVLPLGARLAEGDKIVGFSEKDLTGLPRLEAAQILHRWMNGWRAGNGLTQVHVLREDRRMTFYLQFPEETKDLLVLVRHPSLQLEPLPDRDPRLAEPTVKAPAPDQVDRAVDAVARDVLAHADVFADVVVEMRQRTDSLRTTIVPVWPDESARGIAMIDNPLTFRPSEMPVGASVEIGKWWGLLSKEDRIAFAKYFGLWCAYARTQPAKK